MKIIIQVGILFFICWIAQIIEAVLPFAFPASVIGMLLVFLLLLLKVLKIRHIKETADFLLGNMSFFFLPVGVSIINYFDILKNYAVQIVIICVVSTVLTFAATAYSMKAVLWLLHRKQSAEVKNGASDTQREELSGSVFDTRQEGMPGSTSDVQKGDSV